MRWTLTITATCDTQPAARAFAAHFESAFATLSAVLPQALPLFESACRAPVDIFFSHVRVTGTLAPMDWAAFNRFAQALLARLRSAPVYAHCRVAAEIEAHADEISGAEETYMPYETRVQSESAWRKNGTAPEYIPFSAGYRWIPMPVMDGTPQAEPRPY